MLTIDAVGPGATIQDDGRFGLLRFGVTPAGPMDPPAFATAYRALGNAPGAAAIEVAIGGIVVSTDTPLVVAFAGGGFRWSQDERSLPAAARVRLHPGQTLRARAGAWGRWSYLAVPGGFNVAPVLGSRATHLRSAIGGLSGRMIAAGDRLSPRSDAPAAANDDAAIVADWLQEQARPIRVVLGPQDDHFTSSAVATFLASEWRIASSADRMAFALEGPRLETVAGYDIVSDGIALGAIQVAGDGRPLVLMADRQPTGGYPKIAHVCRADIGRLAQRRPGRTCRFEAVTVAQARTLLLAADDALADTARHLSPLRVLPPAERLADTNLIGGVSDGRE